ncbi:hypothetical protein NVV95_11550 [Herbiconiux sp. CPCC 205716]|uniref:Uncharacterized protein n=1 Tax=Herbiconiux gentiana TaxID=2970912 RepID=A0ABT2GIT1_9MICO|nr:hypothetical protein [Herbiconiux gentiana]MCS5715185.1 hypothetical protein [Herbiconiux gentiana]
MQRLLLGVIAWPVVGVVVLLVSVGVGGGGWDMSIGAALGVLGGTAGAYAVCGLVVWVPVAAWLVRRGARHVAAALLLAGLGVVVGGGITAVLVLLSGNASWPGSLGIVVREAGGAGVASVVGWLLVVAVVVVADRRRAGRSVTSRRAGDEP